MAPVGWSRWKQSKANREVKMPRKSSKDVDELQNLRQENTALRKRVTRLRKQLEKFQDPEDSEDEDVLLASKSTLMPEVSACKKCGSTEFKFVYTPQSKISVCAVCKNRTKIMP